MTQNILMQITLVWYSMYLYTGQQKCEYTKLFSYIWCVTQGKLYGYS